MSKPASGTAFVVLARGMTVERREVNKVEILAHGELEIQQVLPHSVSTEVWAAGAWESFTFTEKVNA